MKMDIRCLHNTSTILLQELRAEQKLGRLQLPDLHVSLWWLQYREPPFVSSDIFWKTAQLMSKANVTETLLELSLRVDKPLI
jgi:hypothetical protein